MIVCTHTHNHNGKFEEASEDTMNILSIYWVYYINIESSQCLFATTPTITMAIWSGFKSHNEYIEYVLVCSSTVKHFVLQGIEHLLLLRIDELVWGGIINFVPSSWQTWSQYYSALVSVWLSGEAMTACRNISTSTSAQRSRWSNPFRPSCRRLWFVPSISAPTISGDKVDISGSSLTSPWSYSANLPVLEYEMPVTTEVEIGEETRQMKKISFWRLLTVWQIF